jgi:hypothetical protein
MLFVIIPLYKPCEKSLLYPLVKKLPTGQLRKHEQACSGCYVESHWREFDSYCETCEGLSELFYIYHHRLAQIRSNALKARFKQVHGRPPLNVLELMEWSDTQH